jgi:hypothetical protein
VQSEKGELQVSPQLVPSHVAVKFGSVGQVAHRVPHVAVAVLFAQAPEQAW